MFELAEILNEPWARAALSEQFNVWRGESDEWKLFLPGKWPTSTWKEPPATEMIVEGTETIRSLIGGEEWRAFTLETRPLFELLTAYPGRGHWDEDEEIEPLVPFLKLGLDLLDLDAERFTVEADGTIHFQPGGLRDLDSAQVQQLIERRPKTWKARPPRGPTWTPTWQMLWLWIEAARTFWGSHFANPVVPLTQTYANMAPHVRAALPVHSSEPVNADGLPGFIARCEREHLHTQVRLYPNGTHWHLQLVVQYPAEAAHTGEQREKVIQLAIEAGLGNHVWNSGWSLVRSNEGIERWHFEVASPPLDPSLLNALNLPR